MVDAALTVLDEWGFWLTIIGLMVWAAWCDHKRGSHE